MVLALDAGTDPTTDAEHEVGQTTSAVIQGFGMTGPGFEINLPALSLFTGQLALSRNRIEKQCYTFFNRLQAQFSRM